MPQKANLYKKVVYWSDEDDCFIGTCPELMFGGVHGDDPVEVFKELNQAVDEAIEIFKSEGKTLPEPKNLVFEPA
jgi:predicted RNase H-like HicB family nuclease